MRIGYLLFLVSSLSFSLSALAASIEDGCGSKPSTRAQEWLQKIRGKDSDTRGRMAFCLARYHLEKKEVAEALLGILRSPEEDLFVREDVAIALRYVQWRKKVALKQDLGPSLSDDETKAINRALASVKPILEISQNVKQISNILPVTKLEDEFLLSLTEIFADPQAHVQFRIAAINSISAMVEQMVESDVYNDRLIRNAYETILTVSKQNDFSNYFAGAEYGLDRFSKLIAKLESQSPDHPLVRSLASVSKSP